MLHHQQQLAMSTANPPLKIRRRAALARAIAGHALTQERIALECGIHPSKLSRIVNGLAVPTPIERRRLADKLKLSVRKLFPKG